MSIASNLVSPPRQTTPSRVELAESTRDKISRFGRRRRLIGMTRGLALTVAVACAALLVAVLVDGLIVHPVARWFSAILFYVSTVAAAVVFCREFFKLASISQEAGVMESHAPELEDRLLSAVELSEQWSAHSPGSLAFQAELQREVAAEMGGVNPSQLLRWQSIQRALAGGVLALAAVVLLCFVPSLHLPQRIARTLFPFANLGRISDIAIEIELPSPASGIVAEDDVIAVRARVEGRRSADVWLETRNEMSSDRIAMTLLESSPPAETLAVEEKPNDDERRESTFESTLSVEQSFVDYRVVSGSASTAWHRLRTMPRPSVEEFAFQVRLPDYASESTRQFRSPRGDITVLAGSRVTLAIRADQKLSSAALLWLEVPEGPKSVDLQWDPERQLYATSFEVTESLRYRVAITAEESGFSNEYSESYDITCVDDLEPAVRWEVPQEPTLTAGIEEILTWEVRASDELALAKLAQEYRVNSGEVQSRELNFAVSRLAASVGSDESDWQARYRHGWSTDLLPMKLQAGDYLETWVRAVDQHGHSVATEKRTVYLSSRSLDLSQSEADQTRRDLAEKLESVAVELEKNAPEKDKQMTLEQVKRLADQTMETMKAASAELTRLHRAAARANSDPAATSEMRLVGELLSQIENTEMRELEQAKEKQDDEATQKAIKSLHVDMKYIARNVRALVTQDVMRRHSKLLKEAAQAQRGLVNQLRDDSSKDRITRQHQVLLRQLRSLAEDIEKEVGQVSSGSQGRYRAFGEQLGQIVGGMESQRMSGSVEALRKQIEANASALEVRALDTHVDGNIFENQKRAIDWFESKLKSSGQLVRDFQRTESNAEEAAVSLLNSLQQRRELRRAAESASWDFARDLGQTKRALQRILEEDDEKRRDEQLDLVRDALQVLELANELQESSAILSKLTRDERWQLNSVDTRTDSPRNWEALQKRLEQAARQAHEASIDSPLIQSIEKLRWDKPAQEASQRIASRRWDRSEPKSAASDLMKLAEQLSGVQTELKPAVEKAREIIDEAAPTISELAKEAAEKTKELSEDTERLSQEVEEQSPEANEVELAQLEQQKDRLQSPMQELREALVDRAETHDLLDAEELDHARADDAGLQIVDRAREQTNESLDEIPDGNATKQEQKQALVEAAGKQADAAEALEQLANIFEPNSNESSEANSTPQENSDMARLEQIAQEMSQQQEGLESNSAFDQAESLAELAEMNSQELLEALERELQTDQPMQSAMSDIAKAAAERALEDLQQAARKQQELTNALEDSDAKLKARKQLLAHDLNSARTQARDTLQNLVQEANNAARQAKQPESAEALQDAADKLSAASENAKPTNGESMESMQQKAKEFSEALENAGQRLAEAQQGLLEAQAERIHDNGADLNNRRRETRDRQARTKQTDERQLRQAESQASAARRQAEQQLQQAKRQTDQQQRNLDQLNRRAEKSNDPDAMAAQQERQQNQVAAAESRQQAAEQLAEKLKQREQQAKKQLEQSRARPEAKLESENPAAEFASDLLEQAQERTEGLAKNLGDWAQSEQPVAEASANQLASSARKQGDVQEEVEQAADDLGRASRHEERLDNQESGEALAAVAGQANEAAASALGDSQQAMQEAAAQAMASPSQQASSSQTSDAQQAGQSGEEAIRDAAESLEQLLAQQSAQSQGQSEGAQGDSQQQGQGAQSQNAQLPDAQSRAQNSPQSQSANQPSSQSAQSSTASNSQRQQQGSPSKANSPSSSATSPLANLSPQEKAQLLDELDRQMSQSDANLGQQDNNSQNPMQSSAKMPPGTLAQAAKQLAMQLSRSQAMPQNQPTPSEDLGMATESTMANVDPQGPVDVSVTRVNRVDGDWGKLRDQKAEGAIETKRSTLAPHIQAQVDAYFRSVAKESAKQ